jgi:hypothetical protein
MRTAYSQIEITPDGILQIRLAIAEGDEEPHYHRTTIPPGTDVDAQMDAVDVHLEQMGFPKVAPEDRARIKRIAAVEHTPEVIETYRASLPT